MKPVLIEMTIAPILFQRVQRSHDAYYFIVFTILLQIQLSIFVGALVLVLR